MRPGLSGALFVTRSGAKKRERKTEKGAQIITSDRKAGVARVFRLKFFPLRMPDAH